MKAKKLGDAWVIRLETGELLIASLQAFCEKEHIRAGAVAGIGTCRNPTLAFFDWKKKEYETRTLPGDYEITGLSGNVGLFDGRVLVHLHATLGDAESRAWAGHLREAEILAVGEIFLTPLPGELVRRIDPESGLNLWEM
jgi:predicted DNA-binding protein with PD1-like motif